MDTEYNSWDFRLDKNLVIALGWSLYLCITQHPLFTSVIQGWGPRASPLFKQCTTHLADELTLLVSIQMKGWPPRLR